MSAREFSVIAEYHYDRSSIPRWVVSHLLRHKIYVVGFLLAAIVTDTFVNPRDEQTAQQGDI